MINSIIILGIAQALFLSLLILNKKPKQIADAHLVLLLLFYALHLGFFFLNFSEEYLVAKPILIIGSGFPLLGGPILLWYVNSLIRGYNTVLSYLIHSIPYLIYIFAFLSFLYTTTWRLEVFDGFLHFDKNLPWIFQNYSVFFALSGGLYPTACILLIVDHKKKIRRAFSYEEQINLIWLRNILLFTLGAFLITFFSIYFILGDYIDFQPAFAFKITATMLTIYVFLVGYFGLKQTSIFTGSNPMDLAPTPKYQSGIDKEKSKEYLKKIDEFMHSKKPFLNGKLTIRQLSDQLSISPNHISQAINENLNMNFFDYVNGFRVNEVKKKMNNADLKHLSMLGIALESGFNSKSSFNQIFKNSTGFTPSEYKKQFS